MCVYLIIAVSFWFYPGRFVQTLVIYTCWRFLTHFNSPQWYRKCSRAMHLILSSYPRFWTLRQSSTISPFIVYQLFSLSRHPAYLWHQIYVSSSPVSLSNFIRLPMQTLWVRYDIVIDSHIAPFFNFFHTSCLCIIFIQVYTLWSSLPFFYIESISSWPYLSLAFLHFMSTARLISHSLLHWKQIIQYRHSNSCIFELWCITHRYLMESWLINKMDSCSEKWLWHFFCLEGGDTV